MVALKSSVKLKGLQPQAVVALLIASSIAEDMGLDLVVTSANDGNHMATSKHYSGEALDCRTHDWADEAKATFIRRVISGLGLYFDVVFEGAGTDNEHLHVEWDPK